MSARSLPVCKIKPCKLFRSSLKNQRSSVKLRLVPAFTVQALQNNTKVIPPEKCDIYQTKIIEKSVFVKFYDRGDFPIVIKFGNYGKTMIWKIPVEKLDYQYYLPMFFDGLSIDKYPYNFVVRNGITDLIIKAPYKVLPILPQLILPLKRALSTNIPSLMYFSMECIQTMIEKCNGVGLALVPYYKHLLPPFSLYQGKGELGETIWDTLNLLEKHGGPNAFVNIKSIIPTYESYIMN